MENLNSWITEILEVATSLSARLANMEVYLLAYRDQAS